MDLVQKYVRHFDIILSKLCQNCEELDFAENCYYRINQILLSMVQLWQYEQSVLTTINRILFLTILLSLGFFQFTTFITYEYTIDFFIELLSNALLNTLCILQYFYFYINIDKMKQMWKDIQYSWNHIKDQTERDIMRRYSYIGEFTTIFMTLGGLICNIMYVCLLFSPIMLDTIFPLNETRPHKYDPITEYFVDYEKYYYAILYHWAIGLLLCTCLLAVTYGFLIVYNHNICELLKVTCYRIEQAVDGYIELNSEKMDSDFVQKLREAVHIHREALMYADFLTSTFVSFIVIVIIIGAVIFSLNWLRLMRGIILQNTTDLPTALLIITVHFIILFLANYYGQLITDHNSKILNNVYEARWYVVATEIQKLLLFIMKKTTRTYYLNITGSVFTASIETFAKLFKLWVSYSTVIYSLIK